MGCNCGPKSSSGGTNLVYVLLIKGQKDQTFLSEDDARAANTRAGGNGTIIRSSQT